MNSVISKVLCLKFINNKKYRKKISIRYSLKKLVIFIKIFCSKTLIKYYDIFIYI